MSKVKSRISIIEAGRREAAAAAPLFDAYRRFYGQPSDLAGAKRFLLERLSRRESRVFLAFLGAVRVGFIQLYPSFSSVSMKPLWILNDLFVIPEARKQGVATVLLEKARQVALETRAEGLVLETAADNFRARSLYEALGWKRDRRFYRYGLDL